MAGSIRPESRFSFCFKTNPYEAALPPKGEFYT